MPLLCLFALACIAGGVVLEALARTTQNFGYAAALISAGPMLILIALALTQGPERGRAGGAQ